MCEVGFDHRDRGGILGAIQRLCVQFARLGICLGGLRVVGDAGQNVADALGVASQYHFLGEEQPRNRVGDGGIPGCAQQVHKFAEILHGFTRFVSLQRAVGLDFKNGRGLPLLGAVVARDGCFGQGECAVVILQHEQAVEHLELDVVAGFLVLGQRRQTLAKRDEFLQRDGFSGKVVEILKIQVDDLRRGHLGAQHGVETAGEFARVGFHRGHAPDTGRGGSGREVAGGCWIEEDGLGALIDDGPLAGLGGGWNYGAQQAVKFAVIQGVGRDRKIVGQGIPIAACGANPHLRGDGQVFEFGRIGIQVGGQG